MTSRNKIRLFAFVVCVLGLVFKVLLIRTATAQPVENGRNTGISSRSTAQIIAAGEAIALDPLRGNCNACHQLPNSQNATGKSKIGVSLNGMRAKFSDDKKLRALVWDAQATYPQTIMPPYGRHRILSEAEIDDLLAWLVTQ